MKKTHVNIVDLVDHRGTGEDIEIFPNVKALRKYCRKTGKIFPRNHATRENLLSYLLRQIFV
jgi:hypothetical protein